MKSLRLKSRFGLLFSAFVFLVIISGGTTVMGLASQKEDALVINLAGRQRMLIQQLTHLALEIQLDSKQDVRAAAQAARDSFEQTLIALKDGGTTSYQTGETVNLPPTRIPQIRAQLDQILNLWREYKANLNVIMSDDPSSSQFQESVHSIESLSPELMNQIDIAVQLYADDASLISEHLKWIQVIFLGSALLLLGLGVTILQKSIFRPLKQLETAAKQIGLGNLETQIEIQAPAEIQMLVNTLEKMRSQLKDSQEDLINWAGTLENRVVQRTQELEALYTVSREISSRLDISEVLNSVTEKARQLLAAEVAYLCLIDERGQTLNLQSTSGPIEAVVNNKTLVLDSLQGQVLSGDQALMCGIKGCKGFCEIMAPAFQSSHLASSLQVSEHIIGALCVGSSKNNYFPKESLELLSKLANAAAIAIENARLYNQAERSATLEERQRLASEMHDGLAQTLHYMLVNVDLTHELVTQGKTEQAIELLRKCHTAIDQATQETRRAITSLQESLPRRFTLQELLSDLAEEFSNGTAVELVSDLKIPLMIPHQDVEQILRVAREALLNAQKYSQANRITIELKHLDDQFALIVEDDGIGFNPHAASANDGRGHFGLNIMRARAARLGGQLEIDSSPGSGACVKLTWSSNSVEQ